MPNPMIAVGHIEMPDWLGASLIESAKMMRITPTIVPAATTPPRIRPTGVRTFPAGRR